MRLRRTSAELMLVRGALRVADPGTTPNWDHFGAVCGFCHALSLYHLDAVSDGRGTMAERDLTAREDRFIGLCLLAAAIVVIFAFIISYS
jgi:hypothetical protein